MSVATAVAQLLEVEERRGEGAYGPETLAVGVARVGSESQRIVAGPLAALADVDFGPPLHSLVIAGDTHPIEQVDRRSRGVRCGQDAATPERWAPHERSAPLASCATAYLATLACSCSDIPHPSSGPSWTGIPRAVLGGQGGDGGSSSRGCWERRRGSAPVKWPCRWRSTTYKLTPLDHTADSR